MSMSIRPIDIARKLGISTTTLRKYEEMGLVPPVLRSESGYRNYTVEHIAYFICVRDMLPGFNLTIISEVLKYVMANRIDSAYWVLNKAQADLRQDKAISEKIIKHLYHKEGLQKNYKQTILSISDISQETGIPATTIRYWDKIGLIAAQRSEENNYRIFTPEHVQQALAVYALKLSAITNRRKYFIDQVRNEIKEFNYNDKNKIKEIANNIMQNLDKMNRLQIRGIAALYNLCVQVETNFFYNSFNKN
ncbi:transcriptional regulator, MerR family [Desulfofarcimen acetoxidans DSM 771]|uniref:Transcriptional regulator, MerR family n=1 Tax=Desulfofarcimen acetoxidans (strain ATCC 49208 / DSM 771 / KCTC 5769 / VKM B-1644 / 5575) TaxID=485916 RepID=C8VVR5_DESAS|nr:MerR family DNA-binding transcriptional regulator [Desulfofarcimen acetoxidans]ACV62380.1 transcriptional regulator, MerR family [Desulfofarcimen acetoxidans DSM 771]